MAALHTPAENSKHVAICLKIFSEVFMAKDNLDQPYDVTLVVENGEELKAHRQVLSEASPFFEKLLNSDMKESKEGIVRLEMISASAMRNTLEFIYRGHVEILTEGNARDLFVIADYLFLQNLKTLAEDILLEKMNDSNCFSTYYFFERYQCSELFSKATTFICANFKAACAANRKEFLNLSSHQLQMWISSDYINVNAEEDVFKIILAWINHKKSKRKIYFTQLFRQVRLAYVSDDFLCSYIRTNDLVNDSEDCLDLVADAMKLIESKNYGNLNVVPRKCLDDQVPVIVACSPLEGKDIQCYFPREDRWYCLGESPFSFKDRYYYADIYFAPCKGKIYGVQIESAYRWNCEIQMASYDLYSHNWTLLPYNEDRELKQIFAGNENEMYALQSEPRKYHMLSPCNRHPRYVCGREKYISFISKYLPESNSWEDILSFDHLAFRRHVCIVFKDNFIYFIGGVEWRGHPLTVKYLTDVDRYDLTKNQWDKVADIQKARSSATAAVANGKIFIAGGLNSTVVRREDYPCETFDEITNEWQLISMFHMSPHDNPKLLSIDDKLYVLSKWPTSSDFPRTKAVECYDPDKNEWNQITNIPATNLGGFINICAMRIFKGFLSFEGKKEGTLETNSPSAQFSCDSPSLPLQAVPKERRHFKCIIL